MKTCSIELSDETYLHLQEHCFVTKQSMMTVLPRAVAEWLTFVSPDVDLKTTADELFSVPDILARTDRVCERNGIPTS